MVQRLLAGSNVSRVSRGVRGYWKVTASSFIYHEKGNTLEGMKEATQAFFVLEPRLRLLFGRKGRYVFAPQKRSMDCVFGYQLRNRTTGVRRDDLHEVVPMW
mgnify:CR=1 FL=1